MKNNQFEMQAAAAFCRTIRANKKSAAFYSNALLISGLIVVCSLIAYVTPGNSIPREVIPQVLGIFFFVLAFSAMSGLILLSVNRSMRSTLKFLGDICDSHDALGFPDSISVMVEAQKMADAAEDDGARSRCGSSSAKRTMKMFDRAEEINGKRT